MSLIPYCVARSALFALDAETAHELTLDLLARGNATPLQRVWRNRQVSDPVTLAGLTLPNRVGLAAGLDKNARAIDGLASMGFGFVEVGTVTPLPQPGNAKPRLFRLPRAQALINRMGFNNDGLDAFVDNVRGSRFHRRRQAGTDEAPLLLGLNIGKNAHTPMEHAIDDYLTGLTGVYPYADYVTVNISSPNTQNLRDLQRDTALRALLTALKSRQAELSAQHARRVPLFVKIAPDLDRQQVEAVAAALQEHRIEGVIATNTTLAREAVAHLPHGNEAGGLSGAPVLAASNRVIAWLREAMGPDYPIIGVGGILSGADATAKIRAGADAVQIYTGLIYKGPQLVSEVASALLTERKAQGTAPPASRAGGN